MPYERNYTHGEVRAMIDALCEGDQRHAPRAADVAGAAAHTESLHSAIEMDALRTRVTRPAGGGFAPRRASSFHTLQDAITAITNGLNSQAVQAVLQLLDGGSDSEIIRADVPLQFYRARRDADNVTIHAERNLPAAGMTSRINIVVRPHQGGVGQRLWIQTAFPDEH